MKDILEKLINVMYVIYFEQNIKVGELDYITVKYIGSTHQSRNVSFHLTNKIRVIFHNLRGYDVHLKICKFNKKLSVIPNSLEKYMAFKLRKNLVFLDSI